MLSILPKPKHFIGTKNCLLRLVKRDSRKNHTRIYLQSIHTLTDSANIIAGTVQNNEYQHPPIPKMRVSTTESIRKLSLTGRANIVVVQAAGWAVTTTTFDDYNNYTHIEEVMIAILTYNSLGFNLLIHPSFTLFCFERQLIVLF